MAEFTISRETPGEVSVRVHSWGKFTALHLRLSDDSPVRCLPTPPVAVDDGAVDLVAGFDDRKRGPPAPAERRKRRVMVEDDSDDDGGFDEAAYRREGRALLAKQSEKLAFATASPRQAFEWYIEYVVRASLDAEWQEEAAESDDPALAHFFSQPATRAWDAYEHAAELAASEAWGRPAPFDNAEDTLETVSARAALDALPYLDVEELMHPKNAACWACSRMRVLRFEVTLSGTPYSEEYIACTAPLSDLHATLADAEDAGQVGCVEIGAECADRIKAYHNARHWLHHLIQAIAKTRCDRPEDVLTQEFRERMWQESEAVLSACRAYATEGKKTRASSRRYGRRIEEIDGEELSDD